MMFCYQCEQTAGCTGCTGKAGVCGKKEDTARFQDQLTGALVGLAETIEKCKKEKQKVEHIQNDADKIIVEGLFATLTNVNFDNEAIASMIRRAQDLKNQCALICADYDMNRLWQADEDIRSLKSLILFGIRGIAAYAYHARVLGYEDVNVYHFLHKALVTIGKDELDMDALLPVVMEVGEVNLSCMALLDKANTETFGHPQPTQVSLTVEKGPFIVITGHDLYDLKLSDAAKGKLC